MVATKKPFFSKLSINSPKLFFLELIRVHSISTHNKDLSSRFNHVDEDED